MNVEGKGFGVISRRGDSTAETDFAFIWPRGDLEWGESGFMVNARTISLCCSSSCRQRDLYRSLTLAQNLILSF